MTKEKATRYNSGKLKWTLISPKAICVLVRVLMFGAERYGSHNWKKGLVRSEILDSIQRHYAELLDGQENDKESGLPHIGHIMANCMFYSYHSMNNSFEPENDSSESHV